MIFCQPKFLILYDYKIISILFIQFYTLFFFYVLSSFLFPAHKRLIYVSISFRLFRKLYRIEIVFSEVRFPFLKNFGGYTSFCFLNNSGLNFLNSKPFVISVLRDLLIQIDLLGFSPLQFFKVSWKKFLPVSSIINILSDILLMQSFNPYPYESDMHFKVSFSSSLLFLESLLSNEPVSWGFYSFGKYFFTYFLKSLYQVCDSCSIWVTDSIIPEILNSLCFWFLSF